MTTETTPPARPTPSGPMQRLKEETWDMHQMAEGQALEQNLIKGTLPKEKYVENIGQRYLIHSRIDSLLKKARIADPRVANIVDDTQFHSESARKDLQFFGIDPLEVEPNEATSAFLDVIQAAFEEAPINLLGIHYVMEGSTNGARFIAKAIRKAYDLEGTAGTYLLDPYGEQQRPNWMRFVQTANAQQYSDAEVTRMVHYARETFRHITAIGQAIYPG
ncbi:MAG: biliverdin-producing heme oxygenase [Candidatus Sumerlaeia bacterium]|nr:biliverdin-producing heme oxygenase [Candidatus Sumerlaeia bacterium]